MATMRYVILQHDNLLTVVEMPATHAYQLSALNLRLHKEIEKLTAKEIPSLPRVIAECERLELDTDSLAIVSGLDYINQLEADFARIQEKDYPLISLLTEIRALQAQLEQWYDELADGLIS